MNLLAIPPDPGEVIASTSSALYATDMPNPDPATLRANLADLIRYRQEHLTGDEKGEAQVFLDHVFRAFGHPGVTEAGATLEGRIKKHVLQLLFLGW